MHATIETTLEGLTLSEKSRSKGYIPQKTIPMSFSTRQTAVTENTSAVPGQGPGVWEGHGPPKGSLREGFGAVELFRVLPWVTQISMPKKKKKKSQFHRYLT